MKKYGKTPKDLGRSVLVNRSLIESSLFIDKNRCYHLVLHIFHIEKSAQSFAPVADNIREGL